MVLYTIKNENNEIQVLDTMGIESLKSITEAVDNLNITEAEKQAIFIDNKIVQVKNPEDFLIGHTEATQVIKTDWGNFYVLSKNQYLSVENNHNDKIFAGVKANGELLIKGDPISEAELSDTVKWTVKPK